jgi:hypothetical protein
MPRVLYIPIKPESLICPRCGASPDQVCDFSRTSVADEILSDKIKFIHAERIKAAAMKDLAAKRRLK